MPEPLGPPPDGPSATPAETAALREAIRRARSQADRGEPGYVAAVISGDRVVAMRANEVGEARDPSRHAEVVAIAAACGELGRTDLTGTTLVSTLQPCEMCLAAMRWAGIGRVVFAARQEAVHSKYFRFGGLRLADYQAAGGGFTAIGGVLEEEVIDLYADGRV